jgi:ribose transport system permease protein
VTDTQDRPKLEPFEGRPAVDSRSRRLWAHTALSGVIRSQSLLIFVVLLGIIVAFSVIAPDTFFQSSNLRLVLQNAAILLVLGVGATFVIITGGIDLSVGSVLVFSGVAASSTMKYLGGEGWTTAAAGAAVAIGSGVAWGLVNGILIAKARIPSMIVTLGTMGVALGVALVLTGGVDISGVPSVLEDHIGYGQLPFGIPVVVVIAVVTALFGAVLLQTTRFGVYTRASGSNFESTTRAGVNVTAHLIKVYALAGACAGLAGILALAQFSTTSISGHKDAALSVITAVILGGTSLFGGVGGIFGTVIGVLIPAVLQNGFVIVGIEPFWQPVATGAVLILAVYIDQLRRSKSAST